MSFTPTQVSVREYGPTEPYAWLLTTHLIYDGGPGEVVGVPNGYETDFASVPWACTWLFPRYGLYTKAAIVHDYLCQYGSDRFCTDRTFRMAMEELEVPRLRRTFMWAAVSWATITGVITLRRRLWLLVLGVAVLVAGSLLLHPIGQLGWWLGCLVIAVAALGLVTGLCFLGSSHRPLLGILFSTYGMTIPGLVIIAVSFPLLVVMGLYQVAHLIADGEARGRLAARAKAVAAGHRAGKIGRTRWPIRPAKAAEEAMWIRPAPAATPRERRLENLARSSA